MKSVRERESAGPSLYTTMQSNFPASMSASSRFNAGRSMFAPLKPPSSYRSGNATHPSVLLALDICLRRLPLRVQAIEILIESFVGGLARVNGAPDLGRRRGRDGRGCVWLQRPFALVFASPKNASPFHFVPVISLASALSEAKRRPSHSKPAGEDANENRPAAILLHDHAARHRHTRVVVRYKSGDRSVLETDPAGATAPSPTRIRAPDSLASASACCRADSGNPPSRSA